MNKGTYKDFPRSGDKEVYDIRSPIIPSVVMSAFAQKIVGLPVELTFNPYTGNWQYVKADVKVNASHSYVFATKSVSALQMLLRTMNDRSVAVKTYADGSPRLDTEATVFAKEVQNRLKEAFALFIEIPAVKKRIERAFSEKFGKPVIRRYDGSSLELVGKSVSIDLYKYQLDAVARILNSDNVLLAHEVGAGKTFAMVAAAMELRRQGISRKNLFVVPKGIISQWRDAFSTLYPESRILVADSNCFSPKKRTDTLSLIKDGDFDGIIIGYNSFTSMKLSKEYRLAVLGERKAEFRSMESSGMPDSELAEIFNRLDGEELRIASEPSPGEPCFDDLGINTLFVDEAHNFKNIPLGSTLKGVLGLNTTGSPTCSDMLEKVWCINRLNNGRGVIFATGTPVTNSVSDMYAIQKYLQYGYLKSLGLGAFDGWIKAFAEIDSSYEIDVTGSGFHTVRRLSRFKNLSQLAAGFSKVSDFSLDSRKEGVPEFKGHTDVTVMRSSELADYISELADRADAVRSKSVSPIKDNMLSITVDGRKAALDMRLIDADKYLTPSLKLYECADKVRHIWETTKNEGCAQLIFCDISTPKAGFNVYDDMKKILVSEGIPEDEIAFVHDAETEGQKAALYENTRAGNVRVLIGSTQKLGIGANVQERLVAVHHLDIPWRPGDVVQREGRILRQGNTCKEVFIYRYVTEGSFDAYSWQILEAKQSFISQLLGGITVRSVARDLDDMTLSFAEVKALAVGNPLVKTRIETQNEIMRLKILQLKSDDEREDNKAELAAAPQRIRDLRKKVKAYAVDLELGSVAPLDETDRTELGKLVLDAVRTTEKEREICRYRGFVISAPDHASAMRPQVILAGEGRHLVYVGESEIGVKYRLDSAVRNLNFDLIDAEAALKKAVDRKSYLEKYFESPPSDFSEKLRLLAEKLAEIDKKLDSDE